MRGWWQDLTDLVLPAECGGCGRPRTVLCPECRAALSGAAPRRVRPVPEPPGLPVVHAAARYADEVRATLLAHKERGALALAGPLGAALAGAVRAGLGEAEARVGAAAQAGAQEAGAWDDGGGRGDRREERAWADGVGFREAGPLAGGPVPGPAGERCLRAGSRVAWPGGDAMGPGRGTAWPWEAGAPVLLVPVPSAPRAVRARGHDPARRIALAAAGELRRTGTPARVLAVLRQHRAVADQSGLNSRQRLDNLAGALAVAPGCARLLSGGPVVLVDDLMTTGASLAEAARAVRAALAEQAAAQGRTAGPAAAFAGTAGRAVSGSTVEPAPSAATAGPAACRGTAGPIPPAGMVGPVTSAARTGAYAGTAGPVTSAASAGTGTCAGTAGPVTYTASTGTGTRVGTAGTGAYAGTAGLVPNGPSARVVYSDETGEGREEQSVGSTPDRHDSLPAWTGLAGTHGAGGVGDVVCAAVVAASPDAFEMNRN